LALIKLAALGEVILTFSMELAVLELSFIGAFAEFESSLSSFAPVDKFSSISDSVVVPKFDSFAVLLVLFPATLVQAPSSVEENAVALGFAVFPHALVNVAVCMGHAAHAIVLSVFGLSLVEAPIWVPYRAKTSKSGFRILIDFINFDFITFLIGQSPFKHRYPLPLILSSFSNWFKIVIPYKVSVLRFIKYIF